MRLCIPADDLRRAVPRPVVHEYPRYGPYGLVRYGPEGQFDVRFLVLHGRDDHIAHCPRAGVLGLPVFPPCGHSILLPEHPPPAPALGRVTKGPDTGASTSSAPSHYLIREETAASDRTAPDNVA